MEELKNLEARFKEAFFNLCVKEFGKDFCYFDHDLGFDGKYVAYTPQDSLREMVVYACNNKKINEVIALILGIKNRFPEIHFLEKSYVEMSNKTVLEIFQSLKNMIDNTSRTERRYIPCHFFNEQQDVAMVTVTIDDICFADVIIASSYKEDVIDLVYYDVKSRILFSIHKKRR